MPSSGARSGTKPSRSTRGAGSGATGGTTLACGHTDHRPPVAIYPSGRTLHRCPTGCGLQDRRSQPNYMGVWCPTCKQDCIPISGGICGFCDTVVLNPDGTPIGITAAGKPRKQREPKTTAETVLATIRAFAAEHGRAPVRRDMPTVATAAGKHFGTWSDAVERAGLPRPRPGRPRKQAA